MDLLLLDYYYNEPWDVGSHKMNTVILDMKLHYTCYYFCVVARHWIDPI